MISLLFGITIRIFSNSFLNVFQKLLTKNGENPSIINFYTYLGLSIIGYIIAPQIIFTQEILYNLLIMGVLGALGNYFIIKSLSCGDLSSIAPINSYKPIVALIFGIFLIKEYPNTIDILGIILIIIGTFYLGNKKQIFDKATLFRFIALVFSGTEAIFIKKIILLTNIQTSFFYWAFASFIFVTIFALISKHPIKIKNKNINYQLVLILMVALMQYSTNYVFSKINVSNALAIFQLSTILSVLLGVNIFKEKGLFRKTIASIIMLIGACLIILK